MTTTMDPMPKLDETEAKRLSSMTVRLPEDLRAELHAEADEQNRTLNGQVVYMLRQQLTLTRRERDQ